MGVWPGEKVRAVRNQLRRPAGDVFDGTHSRPDPIRGVVQIGDVAGDLRSDGQQVGFGITWGRTGRPAGFGGRVNRTGKLAHR